MKKNTIVVALAFATISSLVMPNNAEATEVVNDPSYTISESLETSETGTYDLDQDSDHNVEYGADLFEDEVLFPKNEKNTRESDGTNKFNRATETDRKTFGEDKNVINIDPEVSKNLEETNGVNTVKRMVNMLITT